MKKCTGRFLVYILRHNPSVINVTLDEHGWVNVKELVEGVRATGRHIDLVTLEDIVVTDGKQRFAFNEDQTKIRANQGHSVAVDVEMTECEPPAVLYHGTAEKYFDSIYAEGISKRFRNYVHLSKDTETAFKVGSRHGKSVVLAVDAKQMYIDGYKFFLSANGVWQTEFVPYQYVIDIIRS